MTTRSACSATTTSTPVLVAASSPTSPEVRVATDEGHATRADVLGEVRWCITQTFLGSCASSTSVLRAQRYSRGRRSLQLPPVHHDQPSAPARSRRDPTSSRAPNRARHFSASTTAGATTTPSLSRSNVAMALSMSLPPSRRAPPVTMPPREMTAASDAPAPSNATAEPTGFLHRQSETQSRQRAEPPPRTRPSHRLESPLDAARVAQWPLRATAHSSRRAREESFDTPARSKSPAISRAVTSKSTVAPWAKGRKTTT